MEVVGTGVGFGEPVAGLLATGDDDDPGDVASVEEPGTVEAGPEVG